MFTMWAHSLSHSPSSSLFYTCSFAGNAWTVRCWRRQCKINIFHNWSPFCQPLCYHFHCCWFESLQSRTISSDVFSLTLSFSPLLALDLSARVSLCVCGHVTCGNSLKSFVLTFSCNDVPLLSCNNINSIFTTPFAATTVARLCSHFKSEKKNMLISPDCKHQETTMNWFGH